MKDLMKLKDHPHNTYVLDTVKIIATLNLLKNLLSYYSVYSKVIRIQREGTNMFLAKRTLFYILLFILWSSLAMSFSTEEQVSIRSNNDTCVQTNYEEVLTRIANFESYRHIDDDISWSNIQSQWLPNITDMLLPEVVLELLDIRPLDMKVSMEIIEDPQNGELKRSRVWMVFSPLHLPKRMGNFYPKIPLLCTIKAEESEAVHECKQIEGVTYAVRSFSSTLRITKDNVCGGIKSDFTINFNLHREEVEYIYRSLAAYYSWSERFLRTMQEVNKSELFSFYFENLYNQLVL